MIGPHSKRLAAGNLPAKWHTTLQIEGDISKERAKLGELQAELCKLELQASGDAGMELLALSCWVLRREKASATLGGGAPRR